MFCPRHLLGAAWGPPGAPRVLLGRPGPPLGASGVSLWGPLGCPWAAPGVARRSHPGGGLRAVPSGPSLGISEASFGGPRGVFGRPLGFPRWVYFWAFSINAGGPPRLLKNRGIGPPWGGGACLGPSLRSLGAPCGVLGDARGPFGAPAGVLYCAWPAT